MKTLLSIIAVICLFSACGNGEGNGSTDPCDPDPCTIENAILGTCQSLEPSGFTCECSHTYHWEGSACLQDCVAEGDTSPVIMNAPPCCGDLIKVEMASPPTCIPIQGSMVCVAGANGECGPGENECNLPDDCQSSTCVAEGDTVDNTPGAPQCCSGLIKVEVADPPDCLASSDSKVCVKGIDGECGPGETICNVPEDCS